MRRLSRWIRELGLAGLFLLLPLMMFFPQTLGGKTLIPADNLYQYPPYSAYRDAVGAPQTPHNALLSDLLLQNYQWKAFIRQNIEDGEIPLWNPHQFGGQAFMAAGQQSTLYPLSVLYYVLPLTVAYGWFTVINLALAGWLMALFVRSLGAGVFGGVVAGITYPLSAFFIVSAVHPMILGAGVWLPLLLMMAEFILRRQSLLGRAATPLWAVIGAVAVALTVFAGHAELMIYNLLITGFYAGLRLIFAARQASFRESLFSAAWLLGMVALGLALGAVQFLPLYEVANDNWRTSRDSLSTVLGYAHPSRDALMYLMPNFYGSEVAHSYFDWFSMTRQPLDGTTFWGIKNSVEAALYVGILPLVFALFALVEAWIMPRKESPPYRRIVALLILLAASFAFGLPTYALIYYLPGINQLNTAFRWSYAVMAGLAILAGLGAGALARDGDALKKWVSRFGWGSLFIGAAVLGGLLVSRIAYDAFAPLVERIYNGMALAADAFPDARTFYNVQFTNALIFGAMMLGAGMVFLLSARKMRASLWQVGAVILVGVDLLLATGGFNSAADPALLDFTPPVVQYLLDRQAEGEVFRYTTIDAPAQGYDNMLQPNMTMRYGLDDLRGYESIISAGTVAYLRSIQSQPQLDFNRIAPLYLDQIEAGAVDWGRLSLYNLRYIVTHAPLDLPEALTTSSDPRLTLVYQDPDGVAKVYRLEAVGAAYWIESLDADAALLLAVENSGITDFTRLNSRERLMTVDLSGLAPRYLVLSENAAPGWRAFLRPQGENDYGEVAEERELLLTTYEGNFPAARLQAQEIEALYAGAELSESQSLALQEGRYVVRFIYSPTSFQVGAFGSVMGAALAAFLLGLWLWGLLVGKPTDTEGEGSDVSVVARNSIAPIILNLFNRGIDFAFAFVMLRILGPEEAGVYYYATVVFVWFDIFTNFGLDLFVIREASREKSRAGFYLWNSSAIRFGLVFACVPVLMGFLAIRQATVSPPLSAEALIAIGLLYIGLAPASLSKGLTSIFYAFGRAEYPAAVTTITTLNKAVFGVIALLLGYGIVGLAGVSIGLNLVTLTILATAAWRVMKANGASEAPKRPDGGVLRQMIRDSWPLMLNHFLATIFFQIDVVILEALRGARIVGQYSVAYRWLLALNVIPAFFTQALLPVMSRQGRENRESLKRTYTLGIKLLVAIAVPLAVSFTFMADGLTLLLGGAAYMPAGAIALQIMIWSIPIGWMNSLTQYALVALDLQRRITGAFAFAVAFNIVTNLIFIPRFGYQAAAITTIFSEGVLLFFFGRLMQGALGRLAWVEMLWRPALSGAVMVGGKAALWSILPFAALTLGGAVYLAALILLKPLSADERALLAPLLPMRLRRDAVDGIMKETSEIG